MYLSVCGAPVGAGCIKRISPTEAATQLRARRSEKGSTLLHVTLPHECTAAPAACAHLRRGVPTARRRSVYIDVHHGRKLLQLVVPILVKALNLLDGATRDEPHLLGDPAYKVLVVRHQDDAAAEALDAIRQRRNGLEVQVIGRFVKDQQVRLDVRDSGQGDT